MIKNGLRLSRVPRGVSAIATGALVLLTTAELFAADVDRGAALFAQHCAACHTHIPRVFDKSGPNLSGLFGRRSGSADYIHGYSEAMQGADLTWDLGTLMAFITSPAGVVRGTNMVFRGLSDPAERADLLCYLRQATNPASGDAGLEDCTDL